MMNLSFFRKYAERNIPRYTSYPTAPHFSADFEGSTYQSWLSDLPERHEISLYVHVPYCRSMCWYCGCHTKITRQDAPLDNYLEALILEAELIREKIGKPVLIRHLHFGGGTPTILGADRFDRLMREISRHFTFAEGAELAVEIDPRTITEDMVASLAENGINRASLGVQSLDETVQRAINRIQPFEQTANTVKALRNRGIEQVNFDLIYGLPRQTVASCIETVEQSLELAPNRLSVFGYAHLPSFKPHQRMILDSDLPDSMDRMNQFDALSDALMRADYVAVGLDHFARPHDELVTAMNKGELHRNFQGYTTDACDTLIGLGASSIGKTGAGYVQNVVAIGDYVRQVKKGVLPVARGLVMSDDDKIRAKIIEALMCNFRVDLSELISEQPGLCTALLDENQRLRELISDGIVVRDGNSLKITSGQRFVVRNFAACFDNYLDPIAGRHSKAA